MAGSAWERMQEALMGAIQSAPGVAQAPVSAAPEGDWWDRNVGIGAGPAQRAANREAVKRAAYSAVPAVAASLPPWLQALAGGSALVGSKMQESGGKMPPAPVKTQIPLDMLVEAPAVMQAPKPDKAPLLEVLGNLAAANPNGKITFGQLQKLGSVFPGVSTTAKMPGKDAAVYAAMQADLDQYVKHMAGIDAQERAGQLDAQAAAELRDAANESRKNFLARLGIGQTDDKTNLAKYFEDAQKE